ncbi:MAG: bacteriohemerythrin [Gallionellaceae bacterium]|nr:MAG: bacteriohemerythrin [Gallionellaceae bacterium]
MPRCEIFSAPCIWAKSGFLEMPLRQLQRARSQIEASNHKRFPVNQVLVFAAVAFTSLLVGNRLFDNLREGLKQEAQRNVTAVGTLKANQIRDWVDDRKSDAGTLADNPFFAREAARWMREGAPDDNRRGELVGRLEKFLDGHRHHFRTIILYDKSGRAMLTAGKPIPDSVEVGREVGLLAEQEQFKLIDLHRHHGETQSTSMGFIAPLREGRQHVGAIYLAEDPAQYLFPLMDNWPSESETAETQLVRIEGNEILFLNQMRFRNDPPLGYRLPLDAPQSVAAIALRGKQGLLEHAHDYREHAVLSYATAINGTPWVLISKIDEDEAYRLADLIGRVAGLLALFVFGLTGILFWQWNRRQLAMTDSAIMKERVRADTMQMEAEKRFRSMFEHTALPMVRNSPTGEFIEVNEAWVNMFGYSREEVLAQHLTWQQITHPDDMESGVVQVRKMLAGEIGDFKSDIRYLHKNGRALWGTVQMSLVRDENGVPDYIISAIQDITERKRAEQQINFMAYHDKLTGLPNRALFFDRLSQTLSQARRSRKHVALLYLDLDGFKPINDIHGHEAGDAVLKMAAQRLLACVRAVDTVSRLGGDEFAVVVGELGNPAEIERVAENILEAFAQSLILPDGGECTVGTSIGISVFPDNGDEMDSLLAAADAAMYESKHKGKNTYTYFGGTPLKESDPESWMIFDSGHHVGVVEIDEQHRELVRMVNRLNGAIKNKEGDDIILKLYDELLEFTAFHFATEHRLMEHSGYPEMGSHDMEHTHLIAEAVHFKSKLAAGGELLALQSIKDWLLNHIHYSDKPMANYLREHGVH